MKHSPFTRLPAGLYAITPDDLDLHRQTERVARALEGGIDVLQLRIKGGSVTERARLGDRIKQRCDAAGVPLIVNDDLALTLHLEAAGLHVGQDDGDPRVLRDALGAHRWLGVSCYDRWELALAMQGLADYVGFGSVFPSPTKPQAVRAPLTLFEQARAAGVDAVAIGGIDHHNARLPIRAGARAVAVITDLFGGGDPAVNARRLQQVIRAAQPPEAPAAG